MEKIGARVGIFLSIIVSLTVVAVGCGGKSSPTVEDRATVIARKYEFDPGTIHAKVGEELTITMRSEDVRHVLVSQELGIPETVIEPDKPKTIRIKPEQKGVFTAYCVEPGAGHSDMRLSVVVE